jgi:hypothetical protein
MNSRPSAGPLANKLRKKRAFGLACRGALRQGLPDLQTMNEWFSMLIVGLDKGV